MQSIAQWLINGTYEQGVQLYKQHGQNSFLKQKFAVGPDAYNVAKLREELTKIESQESRVKNQHISEANAPNEDNKTASGVTGLTDQSTDLKAPPSPEAAQKHIQLIAKKDKLYRVLNVLMEEKHHLPEGDDLRKCAVAILTTHRQITDTWAAIDFYEQHGRFADAETPAPPPEDPKKAMQLLRQTISKAKARLDSPNCRDRVQTAALLAKSETELATLVATKPKRKAA